MNTIIFQITFDIDVLSKFKLCLAEYWTILVSLANNTSDLIIDIFYTASWLNYTDLQDYGNNQESISTCQFGRVTIIVTETLH